MIIRIIRHAETEGNLKHQFVGRIDNPLAKEGIQTAENSDHYPDAVKVYTSNLKRTIETAQIIFPNATISEVVGLREIDFGDFEGKAQEDLKNHPAFIRWLETNTFPECPGGEKLDDFVDRCSAAFKSIVEDELKANTPELNFVIHGGTIMALMNVFATPPREFFDWRVGNCKGYCLKTGDSLECAPNSLQLMGEI